jgi:hypothetical protein
MVQIKCMKKLGPEIDCHAKSKSTFRHHLFNACACLYNHIPIRGLVSYSCATLPVGIILILPAMQVDGIVSVNCSLAS